MKDKFSEVERIFLLAIDLQRSERVQFVKEASCGDEVLEREILAILDVDSDSHGILDNAPAAAAAIGEISLSPGELQAIDNQSSESDPTYDGPVTSARHSEASNPNPRQDSVLDTLSAQFSCKALFLKDDPDQNEALIRPSSIEIPKRKAGDRYQLQGEIARGGMGAVLKGVDTDLGRSLAVKVLLDRHRDKPEVIQRFVEEAQIGGQLQHPGIAPVYELGQFDDSRPYFTMKLVNGDTLAALLADRISLESERAKFLGIFEQVCQTMAYAHTRGVVHRDLKPANIMVGAFGEVQVMDWGVAKVLSSGGIADEKKSMDARQDRINTS
ncbi:MAG: serine/threonine-protein kinase, partial [Cyanobacteria bacterium P01_F01_bin.42]